MKKTYTKPEISFESFLMSTNIAGNCDTIVDNSTKGICAYITRTNLHVFTSKISGCTTREDDDDYNGICYHVPLDDKNLFNS